MHKRKWVIADLNQIFHGIFVKEQRVDGSWYKNKNMTFVFKVYSNGFRKKLSSQNPFLVNNKSFTLNAVNCLDLKGFNLPGHRWIKNLFPYSIRINISNNTSKPEFFLSKWSISGFTDAEGCFRISILKNANKGERAISFKVRLYFQIGLHRKDEAILELIKTSLGVGRIYRSRSNSSELQVSYLNSMRLIIEHFDNYPLISKKGADYLLFKKAYQLILNKEHLSNIGLKELVSLKASINKGISPQLKNFFLDTIPVNRENVVNIGIPNPDWVAGFISGEGSFMVKIFKSSNHKTGYQVQLKYQLTQQFRDKTLMETIAKYLDCGSISIRGDIVDFYVVKLTDITKNIIPFFEKYRIVGVKSLNYEDFIKVADIMNNKDHLTEQGLEKIKQIKSNMNDSRVENKD